MSTLTTKKTKVKEILNKYRKAGEIAKAAKELAQKITVPGASVYEVCEEIEGFIQKQGAKLAFPTNLSINHEAAHYSAEILDDRIIPEEAIVKIDLGAHIDGYIVDTAITINHDPELDKLTEASKAALDAAIAKIKPGVKVLDIGKEIENVIRSYGFNPVQNLTGHQIKRYNLHAGVSIPNVGPSIFGRENSKIEAGKVYAIEPFASTGKGWVDNGPSTNIFMFIREPSRSQGKLFDIYKEYRQRAGPLPFSPRILHDKETGTIGRDEVNQNLKKLKKGNIIMGFPVLQERKKTVRISQHEHTVRVTRDGAEIFT